MEDEKSVSIGNLVRDRKSGFVGQVVSIHISKADSWVLASRRGELEQSLGHAIITFDDVELVADTVDIGANGQDKPAPAGSDIAETVIIGQDKSAKPIGGTTFGIDLKVSDEGKAMLDKLQLAAENAKAVGLTSGSTEPKGLHPHEKDAIKQALLDAAKQGSLNERTADMLIEQFQQVDAA